MKILSDFDGVWTDQALEARAVKLWLAAEAARLAGVSGDVAVGHFEDWEALVRRSPERWGWAPDGRITAYVDEDPFCVPNAIAAYLAGARGDTIAVRYREAIQDGGFASVAAFADRCFLEATTAYREQHPPALVPHAAEVLDELRSAGATVVVVSNSPASKIVGWFRSVGADAGEQEGHEVRVRGEAGKHELGPGDDGLEVAGRRVLVDRPRYRAVLEAEAPDLVIGDVFSLDLALPGVLRSRGLAGAPREIVLRRHVHTPAWVLDGRAGGAIDRVVEDVRELVDLVRAAR